MGPGDDPCNVEHYEMEHVRNHQQLINEDTPLVVQKVRCLDLIYFRSKLIEQFDILHSPGQLVWPKNTKPIS